MFVTVQTDSLSVKPEEVRISNTVSLPCPTRAEPWHPVPAKGGSPYRTPNFRHSVRAAMRAGSMPMGCMRFVIARASWANLGLPEWIRSSFSCGDKATASPTPECGWPVPGGTLIWRSDSQAAVTLAVGPCAAVTVALGPLIQPATASPRASAAANVATSLISEHDTAPATGPKERFRDTAKVGCPDDSDPQPAPSREEPCGRRVVLGPASSHEVAPGLLVNGCVLVRVGCSSTTTCKPDLHQPRFGVVASNVRHPAP